MNLSGYLAIPEPRLSFEAFRGAQDEHPLRGLKDFGPYTEKLNPIPRIRVAAIYPEGTYIILEKLVGELHTSFTPTERRNYLEEFTGIDRIFKNSRRTGQSGPFHFDQT